MKEEKNQESEFSEPNLFLAHPFSVRTANPFGIGISNCRFLGCFCSLKLLASGHTRYLPGFRFSPKSVQSENLTQIQLSGPNKPHSSQLVESEKV